MILYLIIPKDYLDYLVSQISRSLIEAALLRQLLSAAAISMDYYVLRTALKEMVEGLFSPPAPEKHLGKTSEAGSCPFIIPLSTTQDKPTNPYNATRQGYMTEVLAQKSIYLGFASSIILVHNTRYAARRCKKQPSIPEQPRNYFLC